MFSYNELHKVVVCQQCKSCIIPSLAGQTRHLRAKPHRLLGDALKTTIELLGSFNLRSVDELRREKPLGSGRCQRIEHLRVYNGFRCLNPACSYSTCRLQMIQEHVAGHGTKAKEHKINPLWEACMLQTYFVRKGRIDYFVVVDMINKENSITSFVLATLLKEEEKDLLAKLESNCHNVRGDIAEQAGIV